MHGAHLQLLDPHVLQGHVHELRVQAAQSRV
jgi:hypothetical protein